ncbi:MAG: class I tRNA ligase family protein, partial [Raineya sp.]
TEGGEQVVVWFEARLNEVLTEIDDHFTKYRISEALQTIYKLFWDDYCSWYLEIIKPEYGKPISTKLYEKSVEFLDKLLRILHPFMPFITEEVWQNIAPRQENESICVASYPKANTFDKAVLKEAELAFEAVSQIRNMRNSKGISTKEVLEIAVKKSENEAVLRKWQAIIEKLANAKLDFVAENPEKGLKFLVKTEEFFAKIAIEVDLEQVKKDLAYYKGFKESILKKLSNEKFVANAKSEIVENERKKLADAEMKIKALEEMLC